MGVDKAGDQDPVGRVDDHGRVGCGVDVGPYLTDLSILDQHVAAREVADLGIERQDNAALEHDPTSLLQPRELGVGGALRLRGARHHLRDGRAGQQSGAASDQITARWRRGLRLAARECLCRGG